MQRLLAQVALVPRPRHDDDRRDVAQLGGERLVQQGAPLGLAALARGAGAEDDGLEGFIRAGQVDRVHGRMGAKIRALVGAASHDAQEAAQHQRLQALLQQWAQIGVDGVELEQCDVIGDEQLVQRVVQRQEGGIASAQDQGRHAGMALVPIGRRLARQHIAGCHARLHPHLAAGAHEEHAVEERLWEDVHSHPPIGLHLGRGGQAGTPVALDVVQRAVQQPHPAQRHGVVGPVLALAEGVTGGSLGLEDGRHPALTDGRHALADLGQQGDALVDAGGDPGVLVSLQHGQGLVQMDQPWRARRDAWLRCGGAIARWRHDTRGFDGNGCHGYLLDAVRSRRQKRLLSISEQQSSRSLSTNYLHGGYGMATNFFSRPVENARPWQTHAPESARDRLPCDASRPRRCLSSG